MPSDSIQARKDAYLALLEEITPQIRGLRDKVNDQLSPELRTALQERLTFLESLMGGINSALGTQRVADEAAASLEGSLPEFPTVPPMEIHPQLKEELDREGADDQAARDGFAAIPPAVNISVNLGAPVDKEQ